jgi:cytosine/adenosine deaminase-related metal-dependent hydrolase
MVTIAPARLLRLDAAGRLEPGAPADFLLLASAADTPEHALVRATRRDVLMVAIAGQPRVAAPAFAAVFDARRTPRRAIVVDGAARLAEASLARAIERSPIHEPGVKSS